MDVSATTTALPVTTLKKINIGSMTLESGRTLAEVELAVETSGTLSPTRDNVILVCHALTGDAAAVGTEENPGWWRGLIGPGRWIDTDEYYIVTMNVLGGCSGSTGPTSINPRTDKPYAADFPQVTIRDMVKAQYFGLRHMGISGVHAVIGGSMGGMQALEWAIMYPFFAKKIVPIAASLQFSPMGIAYNDIARQAIMNDPEWQDGYYNVGKGPKQGLSIARMVGMVTYRTEALFQERFARKLQHGQNVTDEDALFEVESYIQYQGEKLTKRFDANSYLRLLKSMDTHDIGRGRGGIVKALKRIRAEAFVVGIREDVLFPVTLQRDMHEQLTRLGLRSEWVEISSIYGHDAFLVDFDQWGERLRNFLQTGLASNESGPPVIPVECTG